ncbi:hypothetical protein PoB_000648300 [Plakobranchus ocellatus]|uniref:Uncharacterized protein n=1 Tax=Plakobranchus ocellatus TaxID=259542 RepID=A0AAV3YC20_9GAST|nr:hypothetical protein PoB_000648300 [Plakobranchus ocellatus]
MVSFGSSASMQPFHSSALQKRSSSPAKLSRNNSSTAFEEKTGPAGLQSLSSRFESAELNDNAIHLILNSWGPKELNHTVHILRNGCTKLLPTIYQT